MNIEKKPKERTRGLDRAFQILDILKIQKKPLSPGEIAKLMDAPRSSIYELINALLKLEVVIVTENSNKIYIGPKLYYLGKAYSDRFSFFDVGQQFVEQIAKDTRETSQLCYLDGNKYLVALMQEGTRPFRISANVGELIPIPYTASGRLLVAHMSDKEIRDFIPEEDLLMPDGSWLSIDKFIEDVHSARKNGFFTFNSIVDNFTHCFAVPIKDRTDKNVATICLVTPRDDGNKKKREYIDTLLKAASDFEELMIEGLDYPFKS